MTRIEKHPIWRRIEYLHLIDYEKKSLKKPLRRTFRLVYFRLWMEDGIRYYYERNSALYPNVLALNLMTTRGMHLSSESTKIYDYYYNQTNEYLDIISEKMYHSYEVYTSWKLRILNGNSRVADASLILTKRVKVFNVLQLGKNKVLASTFQKACFLEMSLHRIKNPMLVVDLIQATCITADARQSIWAFCNNSLYRECERLIMESARVCRFQFWGFWCRDLLDKPQNEMFCPSLKAFYSGNDALLSLLFDYGFQADLRPIARRLWMADSDRVNRLSLNRSRLPSVVNSRIVLITVIARVMTTPYLLIMEEERRKREEEATPEGITPEEELRRRFILQSGTRIARAQFERYMKCLRLLWRSIPSPYMGKNEFLDVLKNVFHIPDSHMKRWRSIYKVYEFIVPENCVKQQAPRSLMHQSRCVIRDQLHKQFMMPNGVQELKIPQRIKDYLLLRW